MHGIRHGEDPDLCPLIRIGNPIERLQDGPCGRSDHAYDDSTGALDQLGCNLFVLLL